MKVDHGGRGTRDEGTPTGIGVATGAVLVVGATLLAAALFPSGELPGRLAVVALTVGGYAALVPGLRALAGVTVLAVACFVGFLVNRFGELTGVSAQVWAYSAVIGFAALLGTGCRWARTLVRPAGAGPAPDHDGTRARVPDAEPSPHSAGSEGRSCGPVHP
ncbi:hypothetical protein [Micromonospora musae]|uniref:hypothetical protein n=1 Tax=Micromonospora musae TaxID=1894970 RepID=UPI0033DDAD27